MPAVSKAQQRFMGMVYATKKGDMTNPSPEVAQAAASMKKSDAKDFASTKHKKLPEKKVAKEETLHEDEYPVFVVDLVRKAPKKAIKEAILKSAYSYAASKGLRIFSNKEVKEFMSASTYIKVGG